MDETVLIIAVTLASLVGSPVVQGVKTLYQAVVGKALEGKPAVWMTLIVSMLLAVAALGVSGAFAPPLPTNWQDWAILIGGSVGTIFAVATVVFKTLIKPAE